MPRVSRSCAALLLAALLVSMVSSVAVQADPQVASAEQLEYFERYVRPLLIEHCYECHSGEATPLQAGLRVDHRAGLLAGGDSGPAIVPGAADKSLLVEAIRFESFEMPPQGKLTEAQIAILTRWVDQGAFWPEEAPPQLANPAGAFDLERRRAEHWVWQPIAPVSPPPVKHHQWPVAAIDHFILHDLEQAGLSPAEPVDRRTLIRRLYFDLIGLPPTPEQVETFLNDRSPTALQRLVDSLLQSPQFGERWGRHWLDLVRYAESRGHEFDYDIPNAFQYRDYVIRGLNADIPYDQWVTEHLAGDLLPHPRRDPHTGVNESILGTGFWFFGEWVHSPVDIRKDETDRFDNMIDVMSKAFLGLTVACARCHDHKFDAISAADYYALSGFLQSSDYRQVRFESIEHNRQIADELAQLDQRFRKQLADLLAPIAGRQDAVPAALHADDGADDGADDLSTAGSPPHVLVDYSSLPASDYLQDGFLFGSGPVRPGQWLLDDTGESPKLAVAAAHAAMSDPFWPNFHSHGDQEVRRGDRLSPLPMSGRTLRTPTVTLSAGDVACRVRGNGHVIACIDSHRLVAGPLHGQSIKGFQTGEQWQWVHLDLERYRGHRLHLEFVPEEGAVLEVAVVTQGASPDQLAEVQQRQSQWAAAADRQAAWLASLTADGSPVAAELQALVAGWAQQRQSLRQRVRTDSRLAIAMRDGSGEDDHLLIRGHASQPGMQVPRRFLAAIDGDQPLPLATRSGRLELARRINDPANPLAARVVVNRIWHHLMGRGIVPTTDDFGVLGQPPTHRALLDHLADDFLRSGRSLKRTIRAIVLSQTYQMSGQVTAAARELDPNNLLWHHRPPKRLEGEAIRDAILAIAGRLDRQMHGPSIPVHLSAFMDGRGRPAHSGPLDGAGRRSVYIAVRRNFLSPFMLAFDTPAPFSTMGRRNVSNVPAQALILMNDPFVVEQARHWAQHASPQRAVAGPTQAAAEGGSGIGGRIDRMYLSAFARLPSAAERSAAVAFLARADGDAEPAGPASAPANQSVGLARWADLAHVLINTKEFVFLK